MEIKTRLFENKKIIFNGNGFEGLKKIDGLLK